MQVSHKETVVTRRWALILYLTLAGLILLSILIQGFLIGTTLFAGAAWGRTRTALNGPQNKPKLTTPPSFLQHNPSSLPQVWKFGASHERCQLMSHTLLFGS